MAATATLEFLNAAHGDAILLSWGAPPRLALFDGGPTGSFELALGPRLRALRAERIQAEEDPLPLDLVSVSHIDDDHIAGIVRLLTDLRRKERDGLTPPFRVERMWHNSFEELVAAAPASVGASVQDIEDEVGRMSRASTVVAASVNQGRDVRDLARALRVAGNAPFGGPVIGGLTTSLHGLAFTVVAPEQAALGKLENKWRETKQRQDPSVLEAAFTDRSIPNLSSICTVLGGPAGRALLTADARGDRVMDGLEALGLLAPRGTVHFDVLQVPHHGSDNNADQGFYERVSADHYVISADGVAHDHPSPDTLEWIVNARGSDGYAIHLTNPIPAATSRLSQLGARRNFTVDSRSDPALGVAVSFDYLAD
jgi:hypothetical protein